MLPGCSSQRFPPLPGRNSTIRGRQLCHPMNLGSLYCLEVGALQKCLPSRCAGLSACIGAGAVSGLAGLAADWWASSFPVKALRSIYPANRTANLRRLGVCRGLPCSAFSLLMQRCLRKPCCSPAHVGKPCVSDCAGTSNRPCTPDVLTLSRWRRQQRVSHYQVNRGP